MRILMLAQFYPPVIGGEERHVRNLSLELAAAGHELHIGTLRLREGAAPPEQNDGIRVHQVDNSGRRLPMLYADGERPMASPLPDPIMTRALSRLVTSVRPDVVHAHNWIVNSYLPVKRKLAVPLVLSLHDYSHVCATKRFMNHGKPCAGPSTARCVACASDHYGPLIGVPIWASVRGGRGPRERLVDRFTPVSRFVAAANGLPGAFGTTERRGGTDSGAATGPVADGSWEVVPNFVPDNLADRAPADRDPALPTEPYLFYAGDLSAQKGILTLLDAYERLAPPRPPLLMVGRPTPDTPSQLPAGVRIEWDWPHTRVLSGFQHCTVAVLPSEWPDPCPTTVLEAMAMGAALITTSQGGIADMTENERSALVVNPGDARGLASAIRRVTDDPQLRQRLRTGGYTAVASFRSGAVARQLERIYGQVTAADSARPSPA